MIVLVARYTTKPGLGDTVEAALRRMAPLVAANEPGCRMYQVSRSNDNPDYFILYEQYVDEAALAAHRAAPHFKEIIEGEVAPLLDKRERDFFTLVV
jgi:autoinducer 2-degrading protein